MSTLEQVFRPILLDCASFGLNGSGELNSDTDDIAAHLPKLAEDFSLQLTVQAMSHLRILRRANSGDFDALQIEALLARGLFRVVPQADLGAIVAGSAFFIEPSPYAAITTDSRELDFPLTYKGMKISSLPAAVRSTWREEIVDTRVQITNGKLLRDEIWNKIFRQFVFGPHIKIIDGYLLKDLCECQNAGRKFSLNSGFGFFLNKLEEESKASHKSEEEFRPRTVHVLTSADKDFPRAKQWQADYVKVLQSAIEEISPSFDVEVTVTDRNSGNSKGGVLHQRSFAIARNARICRLLVADNSINSYLGKNSFESNVAFSYTVNPKYCEQQATVWNTLTNQWANRGFRYKWTSPTKAL